ncbi:hypothetical protein FRN05_17400 [Salmonella enterica subsp. enterica]|nr:hypothetical protein [Salmonella enterica subsp. enterica serovar Meleagridis]
MNEKEWLDGLRHLSDSMIIKLHFELQEKIKKHYKLRADPRHLKAAIQFCEQQIALAPLSFKALKKTHEERIKEYELILGKSHPDSVFYAPAHHGYRQYSTILQRNKELKKLAEIETKRESEGWAK